MSDDDSLIKFRETTEFELFKTPNTTPFTKRAAIDTTVLEDAFPVLPAFLAIGLIESYWLSPADVVADLSDDFGILPNSSLVLGEWEEDMTPILDVGSRIHETERAYALL